MATITATHVAVEPKILYVGTPIALVTTMSQAIFTPRGPDGDMFRIVETYVRRIYAERAIADEESSHIDTENWSPALYVFRYYFGTGLRLGRTKRR
jgi:flavin reductase (DIM6/NTAB) family NADH-FMN oxidoreductase RutF